VVVINWHTNSIFYQDRGFVIYNFTSFAESGTISSVEELLVQHLVEILYAKSANYNITKSLLKRALGGNYDTW